MTLPSGDGECQKWPLLGDQMMEAIHYFFPCLSSINSVFPTFFVPTHSQTPPFMPWAEGPTEARDYPGQYQPSCLLTPHCPSQPSGTRLEPCPFLDGRVFLHPADYVRWSGDQARGGNAGQTIFLSEHLWGPWAYSCTFFLP